MYVVSADPLAGALHRRTASAYRRAWRRVAVLIGWLLSRTEVRAAALVALTEPAPDSK